LVELMVVMVVVGILVTILIPNFNVIRNRVDTAVCISRLRGLYTAFSTYLSDGRGWPQVPGGVGIGSTAEQEWWRDMSVSEMGLSVKSWQCPAIVRAAKDRKTHVQATPISYLPTLFDPRPTTPMAWPEMPWFIEIGNVHGNGNLMIRTDGAVLPFKGAGN
jgi:hypothetical protein